MATYAIGDVQGCFQELQELLSLVNYHPKQDILWFAGDVINRGPQSYEVLEFIFEHQDRCVVILGNHDLHLLAVQAGAKDKKPGDTIDEILDSAEGPMFCEWLRQQRFFHHDPELEFSMIHAGIPPQWTLEDADRYSEELEKAIQGDDSFEFFRKMYGNKPTQWKPSLSGYRRLRILTHYFTRMRFCDADGTIDLTSKGTEAPEGFMPWFEVPERAMQNDNIVFGHWAALRGQVSTPHVYALDTGCVWGGQLSALRLEDKTWFRVQSHRVYSGKD